MNFKSASEVDSICFQMRLADFPRGQNRARINNLFNGFPPFSETDAEANGVSVNVNFLEGTVLAHDARAQFYGAFLKPAQYFTARTDWGDKNKQQGVGQTVTTEMNKIMKRSLPYFENFRSKFAMLVLHGIGPSAWRNQDKWCPDPVGIEDVGVPGATLLSMENMPFFYIYRSFTAPELIRLTSNRKAAAAAGWNMPLVDKCIKWIDKDTMQLMGSNWPEVWSPEKTQERVKGDGGFYAGDQVPTIDCFDFYFWSDENGKPGWKRRMIMDAWSTPRGSGGTVVMDRDKSKEFASGAFLFNPGDRVYAKERTELCSFQYADLSSVAPFRYHSVRSLGFLVYAVCHLQNRMRCKFNESVFEALMNYYRVRNSDDVERALKVDLINRGFVDETIQFIPPQERWQVDAQLVEMGISQNKGLIDSNSSAFTQQPNNTPGDRKTRIQVMNEINQQTALVQSAFNQAYQYQEFEYREIFRRFCKPNSDDPDVRAFQANISKKDVDLSCLDQTYWEIEPTRIMGAGNKSMELAISEQLLQMRNLFDPEPQREILREITFGVTGDADRAARWVPESPLKVSDSIHDAQLTMGVLMQGLPVALKTGQNHKEYVSVMLSELENIIKKYDQQGGMAPADKIEGMNAVANHVSQHLQIVAQDKEEKQFVAAAGKELAKLMNMVKAFQQRLQEQMKKQQAQQGGDPKVASTIMLAKTKAALASQTHAQKAAQKQLDFEHKTAREQQAFEQEQKREDYKTAHEVRRTNLKSTSK